MSRHSLRVLVTGSNRGIGRETARLFASQGHRVALHGRNTTALDQVRDELRTDGYDVVSFAGDISTPDDARAIVTAAAEAMGGLDVLVNNAGIAMRGRFEDLTPSVVERTMQTNVTGTVLTTVAAIPYVSETHGSIVFVSSLAGLWGLPLVSVYSASKMALTAIVQNLRIELSNRGVHVGIAYVGVTQHDSGKAILGVDGSPYELAPRPQADTQSRVARAIYRMVLRRQSKRVLTPGGHVLAFFARFLPRVLGLILRLSAARVDRMAK